MKLCSGARKRMHADPRRAGWVQVGLLVLSVGLSILAGKMLAKKADSPIRDDSPTTLATRGSYMSWFLGIRAVGPVFCWAGDREMKKEKVEGAGKGGDTPEQDIWYEAGWHILGVGPCEALHRIRQGGKVIFNGPITRESHPSGTTVSLGKEGSFVIFWGEDTQPINTFLGGAERVTVSSRWPFMCYIVWNKKRLGSSPVWPLIEYDLERRPTSQSVLTDSQPWYDPELTLTGPTYTFTGFLSNANENLGYLEVSGDKTGFLKTRTHIQLTGNGLPNGQYEVLRTSTVLVVTGTTANGFPIKETRTRIFLQNGTLGANAAGNLQIYEADDSDGANIAHCIAELLFAPFPQGMSHDPVGLEPWDTDSLELLGVEAETDEWRASVFGSEGETGEALLGAMLQDHGVMLPINTATGEMSFRRVRFPTGTLPNLADHIYAGSLPEIETMHGERPVDKLMFAFKDRSRNFSEMTIAIDEDGQASYEEQQRARKVPIVSTVQFFTASALSELRSPEELAPAGEFRLEASREARDLIPGDAVLADGFEEVLRVTSVGIDPLSERVKVNVLPDYYGARKTDFVNTDGGGEPIIEDPEQDLLANWIEVPEQLLGGIGNEQTIMVPRIRAHNQISFASLWLSADDIAYTLWGNDAFVQTGGVLIDPLSATGPKFVSQGPTYTEKGPDNGSLTQDLSADPTNWLLGRQVCAIVSSAGVEICFLQKASIVSSGIRRLDGLLRARYDTRRLAHPAGASVYIFDRDAITPVNDPLLQPLADLYVKTQPGTTAGQVALSAVPPIAEELAGKGQVPIRPDYVFLRAPHKNVPAYATGEGVTVSWAVSSGTPGTGAGGQNAGTAIADPVIPGNVQIELLTTGDVVVAIKTVAATVTELTFSNAEIVAALGSEVNFKLRATHIANGQVSLASPALLVTKL